MIAALPGRKLPCSNFPGRRKGQGKKKLKGRGGERRKKERKKEKKSGIELGSSWGKKKVHEKYQEGNFLSPDGE